jgi:sulfate adenylyltransferase subunit 2
MTLSHLDRLEAEAIHIIRETAAQFRKPVLLYSIGKDSTTLLHLCAKAFFPGKPPFPLLHIDSTWEFREALSFRDWVVRHYGPAQYQSLRPRLQPLHRDHAHGAAEAGNHRTGL